MNWVQRNFKTLIYVAFLVPILTVAFVSISHVASWYGISNPFSWALYLSFGIEIAALSALAAISAQMGRKVYFPFLIVTLIQFIGNIFFAYQFIDINSKGFLDWVDLVDPIVSFMGVESGDFVGHKRFLALFSGGMLPIISLSFLHMLVKFEEEERLKKSTTIADTNTQPVMNIDELSLEAGKLEASIEKEKFTPSDEQLKIIEEYLKKVDEQKFTNNEDEQKVEIEIEEILPEEKPEEPIGTEEPETTIGIEEVETDIVPTEIEVLIDEKENLDPPNIEEKKINRLSYINRNGPNVLTQRI
jgi:hypothetical protein